jgi:hypothetical protein
MADATPQALGMESAMGRDSPFATIESDGAITVQAELIATGLGLSIDALLRNLRAGVIFQTMERGIDEDAGRLRITFRYRNRRFQVVTDGSGQTVHSR